MFFIPPVLHRKPVAGRSVLASSLANSLALAAALLFSCSAALAQAFAGSANKRPFVLNVKVHVCGRFGLVRRAGY